MVVLLAGTAFVRAELQPSEYATQSTLIYALDQGSLAVGEDPVLGKDTQPPGPLDIARAVQAVERLAGTSETRGALGQRVGEVDEELNVDASPDTGVVVLRVTAEDPERAAQVADEWARVIVARRATELKQPLRASVALVRRELKATEPDPAAAEAQAALQRRLETLRVAAALQQSDMRVAGTASVPQVRISPKPLRDLLLAMLGGLILGGLLVATLEVADPRFGTPSEVERAWGAPIIASLPEQAVPADARVADLARLEPFRYVQAALAVSAAPDGRRVVAITSALPQEGKTTLALGLAASLASARRRVLLVDADLRCRGLSTRLKCPERGLLEVLTGEIPLDDAIRAIGLGENGRGAALHVLPAGAEPATPFEWLSSDSFNDLIRDLRQGDWDYVILDCAPLVPVSDAVPLLPSVDAVLVPQRLLYSRADAARQARSLITRAGARIVGVVVGMASADAYARPSAPEERVQAKTDAPSAEAVHSGVEPS